MIKTFKISYFWRQRDNPEEFLEDMYYEATPIFLALEYFLTLYEGHFLLHFDELELIFDLNPDLSTIFEDVPSVLENLRENTKTPMELYFYEQGTDLNLLLYRKNKVIHVNFVKGLTISDLYEHVPEFQLSVLASSFLGEWVRFLKAILKELLVLKPNLVTEESYLAYQNYLEDIQY